ncbi:MAG: hypothetical protein WCY41_05460 [Candidatus Micrarchaeia archaeon]|jgi:hypothetical protein
MSLKVFFTDKKTDAKQGKTDFSQGAVKAALDKAFDGMQKSGVDRIVLRVVPDICPASKNATLGWQNTSNSVYHAKESLPLAETSMMKEKKPYQAIALTSNGVVKRDAQAVEVVDRVPMDCFSLVDPERYGKAANVFVGANIAEFISANSTQRVISAQEILAAIEPQIAEYKQITVKLFEKSGVYEAVEKLEAREFATKADELLQNARAAIASAKKE